MDGSWLRATLTSACGLAAQLGLGQGQPLGPLGSWLVLVVAGPPDSTAGSACPRRWQVPREQEQKPPGLKTQARDQQSLPPQSMAHTAHKASLKRKQMEKLTPLLDGRSSKGSVVVCHRPKQNRVLSTPPSRQYGGWEDRGRGRRVADTLRCSLNFCICLKIS